MCVDITVGYTVMYMILAICCGLLFIPPPPPPSYYGLLLWFPEYFKCIHERELNCTFSLEDPDSCVAPGVNEVCNSTGTIYADSLYASLATIPGTILGVLLINVVGAKPMMSECVRV